MSEKDDINPSHPRVSIISIARSEEEFLPLKQYLAAQTYQDFEFIGEVGGTIPEAWNRAIRRASGEILVFTETDAQPVNQDWLAELVEQVQRTSAIVKGLEVTQSPLDMSNLAGYRKTFLENPFDEKFLWAEDTELVCRLKDEGHAIVQLDCAPVVHLQKSRSRRHIRRAFRYGLYWARLRYRYPGTHDVSGLEDILKMLFKSLLNVLGYFAGLLVYLPERMKRK